MHLSPYMLIFTLLVVYLILGTALDGLSAMVMTLPVVFPLVLAAGFDPVWFGVLIVMVVQIGLISPPVGMNLFVLNALLPGVSLGQIFRGCWPFVAIMAFMLMLLVMFPGISLWLPSLMN